MNQTLLSISKMDRNMRYMTSAAAGVFLALVVVIAFLFFMPSSYWFEVRSVRVSDTTAGVSPAMLVDRSVNQPFIGRWTVSVVRKDGDGFVQFCSAHGTNDYSSENHLPKSLDLDWWIWPTKCPLPTGQYVVKTVWEIKVIPWLYKTVRSTSNIFTVT